MRGVPISQVVEGELESADSLLPLPGNPLVLRRDEHRISRREIDSDALKVMYRLIRHGYFAFLVGGAVRDLLLGKRPKDFDIGTDAHPEEVRSLFRNSRLIGRRFKINHVYFYGGKILEVSTFREQGEATQDVDGLLVVDDNSYGTPETDAFRRDLTINGLFYDLKTFSVIDYVGGIKDLEQGIVRLIGDPGVRIQEDPVRMIRAVRHAARTGFVIEPETLRAINQHVALILSCPIARVWEETAKDLKSGSALPSFRLLDETGLLRSLLPLLVMVLDQAPQAEAAEVWQNWCQVLHRVDELVKDGSEASPAVIYGALAIGSMLDLVWQSLPQSYPDEVRSFWDVVPRDLQPSLNQEHSEEDDLEESEEPRRNAGRRGRSGGRNSRRRRRGDNEYEAPDSLPGQESLGEIIEQLFLRIGMPRREREKMAALLVFRRLLFQCPEGSDRMLEFADHYLFEEAFLLMQLTVHNEIGERSLARWESVLGDRAEDPADHEGPEGEDSPARPSTRRPGGKRGGRRRSNSRRRR